jgi:fructose-bisphosphate aldolase class II
MTARDWLNRAKEEHFAIGAFNAANIETIKAIVAAAKNLNAPVIIEASHGEVGYIGGKNFVAIVRNAREETGLPIFTNLDHSPSPEAARQGLAWGFDLVHFNGSTLPYDENLSQTKTIVAEAHLKNVLVEAELDTIPGGSSFHAVSAEEELKQTKLTDPDQAASFSEKTGTDTLAASFGSIHGFYQTQKHIDLTRLQEIRAKTNCFLSLHGGSGMPDEQVKEAIQIGIVKINVNSELRLAFKKTLEKALADSQELAIYKIMPPVIDAVRQVVEGKIKVFGSGGKV